MAGARVDFQKWFASSALLPKVLGVYPWSKAYTFSLIVFQAANTYVYFLAAVKLQERLYPSSVLGNNISHVVVYALQVFSVFFVAGAYLLEEPVNRFLNGLRTVDTSLRELGLETEYRSVKHNRLSWVLTALLVSQGAICTLLYDNPEMDGYPTYLGMSVSTLIVYGRLCLFTLLLDALDQQFGHLAQGMTPKTPSRVESLAELADAMRTAAQRLHSDFSLFTTLSFLLFFVRIVCSNYFLWNCFFQSAKCEPSYAFFFTANSVLCCIIIWQTVRCYTAVKNKSKEFNEVLYTTLIRDTSRELIKSNKLCLHITMSRTLNFTACGFFDIDFKMVHAIIATVSSYAIIIVQLERGKEHRS